MHCTLCGEESNEDLTVRNINLYVVGSEGTNLCFSCEMIIVELFRKMMSLKSRVYIRGYKNGKRIRG